VPRRCRHVSKDEEADVFLDDFPADMFDQVDPIPSP
jgi:myb proto-oncogene protein